MTLLRSRSSPSWLRRVLDDFDAFLADHAACEKKASATALAFVSHFRDRRELVSKMIELALEELEHFREVHRLLDERGLTLAPDVKDPYVRQLGAAVRRGTDVHLLDRLLIAAIVEARGHERFSMIADALPTGPLRTFYTRIARSEARHHELFLGLASIYFTDEVIEARVEELGELEARILSELELRPALH